LEYAGRKFKVNLVEANKAQTVILPEFIPDENCPNAFLYAVESECLLPVNVSEGISLAQSMFIYGKFGPPTHTFNVNGREISFGFMDVMIIFPHLILLLSFFLCVERPKLPEPIAKVEPTAPTDIEEQKSCNDIDTVPETQEVGTEEALKEGSTFLKNPYKRKDESIHKEKEKDQGWVTEEIQEVDIDKDSEKEVEKPKAEAKPNPDD
jgi:hypothetical protein